MSVSRLAFSKFLEPAEVPVLVSSFRAEGYEGLQLKGAQYAEYVGDPSRALASLGEDPGIYSALITGDSLDEAGQERIAATIAFAAAVGAERIVFCHGHPHEGVDAAMRRSFASTLTDIASRSRDAGVAFSLHHHTDQPVMELADFREFFDGREPGVLGLTVDTAHLARSGVEDLPGFIDEFGAFVDNLHLKDYSIPVGRDGEWRVAGEGVLDLGGVLKALGRAAYAGWICVDEESEATLEEGLRRSKGWLARRDLGAVRSPA
ncbi:sugar phosphate isomerase/epimerase [Rathayibacter sp. VKM Ac-2926]|uniref:sugar phosphate isomerase/epimerase family protein n=1 Tax=Rathayibacter sp. VKM Ac-2926 TaxID=2929477 RepID=UPI0010481111|nr:sugar phosphate isomerase/epimerase [Rathayibacter sp. VKM Ac-2926]MCJ1704164.1 sugar phosphate isomerase/epimerase [Rathayibacter sp. VKM Ac-2926]TCL83182.1 sugar phosphate isomerase/epimerase [Rathayibacter sp. PhB192]TCM28680.1 sugar phosphate isomerase/epimerase [Rathayibacter sp. PhB179]